MLNKKVIEAQLLKIKIKNLRKKIKIKNSHHRIKNRKKIALGPLILLQQKQKKNT